MQERMMKMANGYIFDLNVDVVREEVTYKNRYGFDIAGELYMFKDVDLTQKHPALIVGAPYGGVKEQGPGVYANELAQRGFIVLTFDQTFMGDSQGMPRHVSSPEIFTENFSAAVDYLGLLEFVDREKIGAIGICGSGGFALSAAQVDTRIKAVATASMYDISDSTRGNGKLTREELQAMKEQLSQQRWTDAEKGYPEYIPGFPLEPAAVMPEGLDPTSEIWFKFYGMKRGHHPHARGGFTTTSSLSFLNTRLLDFIDEISPRPILFIIGDQAHSKYYSETAYANAAEPKELYVVDDADHIDLYDRVDRIPFDKMEEFFKEAF